MGVVLFYSGGEVSKFRNILAEFGSLPIAVSYMAIQRNTEPLPDYAGPILLDSGAFSLNKPGSEATFDDATKISVEYIKFVTENIDDVTLVSEFDARQLGLDTIHKLRTDFYNTLPADKFMPVWHADDGREELEDLCSAYPVVAVTQEDIHGDESNVSLFSSMISRYNVKLHGAGITSKKLLEAVKWSSVSSTAWLSVTRYGELMVWTGKELKRYPKSYKDRAKRTHSSWFTESGFDAEKIANDDNDELLRLSAWSWQRYVQSLGSPNTRVTPQANERSVSNPVNQPRVIDNHENLMRTAQPVNQRETAPIPVIFQSVASSQNDDGTYISSPVVNIRSESLRVCNTCIIRNNCPGFLADSNCLYSIPIEVKTPAQMKSLQNGLIEMQSQRVMFMKMTEDVSGGYVDTNLSSEMDRLQRMIKTATDADKDKFSMSVTMSKTPQGPGFFEKAFGVSPSKIELAAPLDADKLILNSEMADIVDAELINE